ncbi:phosphoinositide 3-kinase regulatory subunit 6 isoform X1 [Lepisosteus oculatus]|uniref:phosphoinositide 3-kinase regulatory subunit 6 isoform X1 n=1 Tax=Lepisosteus oculatus TaxID=7918 RepID=UPI00371122E5
MEVKVGYRVSSAVESDIFRSVQAILRELEGQHPASQPIRGMLRWTLHKKIENSPAKSISLVKIVVKELERAERADNKLYIIPLLHTLMYTIIQAAYIPDDLYQRVYDFCKRLLTLPEPYCTIGLSHAVKIKTERYTPGLLYQRMLITEQNIKNDQFPYQEKVLVFADPGVFPGETGAALSRDIESSSPLHSPVGHMRSVIQHTLQAALGESCDGPALARILEAGGQDVEAYFQEVVLCMEHCSEEAGSDRSQYTARLQKLYAHILRTADHDVQSQGSLCSVPLPNPEISFHLWREDEQLWRELAKFVRSGSSYDHYSMGPDFFDLNDFSVDFSPEMTRHSILSNDSGIERDLPPNELPAVAEEPPSGGSEQEQARLLRRGCIRMKPSVSDGMALLQDGVLEEPSASGKLQRKVGSRGMSVSKQQRLYTARVVVMGDDQVLGKLAKAYYSLRKREARRPFLTTKLNLKIYYVPVASEPQNASPVKENVSATSSKPCLLASYLGRVDPWFESNINSLGNMIPKLVKMQSSTSKSAETDPFLVDVISYYIRLALQPVFFTLYSVKITFSSLTKEAVEDVFVTQLAVDFPEFRLFPEGSVRNKKSISEICGAVISVNYIKASLSNRETNRGVSLRTSGVLINAIPMSERDDLDCLTVSFSDSPKIKTGVDQRIRTCSIKIRSLERRTFTVCLDKDSKRVFKDVLSIEVSRCLDPGYCIQKARKSKFTLGDEKDVGLMKYMTKGLPLPINTFAGIIQ